MKKVEEIIDALLKEYDDSEVGIGLTESEITKAEEELDVVFPYDYRFFLSKYGYYESDGAYILGVGCDPDMDEYYSMVYFTKKDKQRGLPSSFVARPDDAVIVSPYGGGGKYFLHCENSSNPGRVELLLTELMGKADSTYWDSFTEFLASQASE